MKKSEMIYTLVENYKKTLKQNSKWFSSDLRDYKEKLSKLSIKEIKERYNKSLWQNTKEYSQIVENEINLMDKNGMFNLKGKK